MTSKVAIIKFDENVAESIKQAFHLIGGIDHLNTKDRSVVVKVGVLRARIVVGKGFSAFARPWPSISRQADF